MTVKRIDVELSDEEMLFIRWLAKRDEVPLRMELSMIFNTELSNLMRIFEKEYEDAGK